MQPLIQFIKSTDFTIQYDLMFYIILIFYNFSKHSIKVPEDGAEAPKHVGASVI